MEPHPHAPPAETGSNPSAGRFRPYASTKHRVTRGRYITSNDRRGYIPVYEYPLNGQWIMMDIDDGYILWTGIWKALGNAKADIVKMLESQPDLAPQLRRVRGGYLKIQGTWMPYEVALRLARRVAWSIREDLIPLFGPTFPSTCLAPDQPGYGQILGTQQGKRRGRRAAVPLPLTSTLPVQTPQSARFDSRENWDSHHERYQPVPGPSTLPPLPTLTIREPGLASPSHTTARLSPGFGTHRDDSRTLPDPSSARRHSHSGPALVRSRASYQSFPSTPLAMGPPPPPSAFGRLETTGSQRLSPLSLSVREPATINPPSRTSGRFSPYHHAAHERRRSSGSSFGRPSPIDLPPLTIPSSQPTDRGDPSLRRLSPMKEHSVSSRRSPVSSLRPDGSTRSAVALPPILSLSPGVLDPSAPRRRSDSFYSSGSGSAYSLPPIATLDEVPPPGSGSSPSDMDSRAVLKRLALDDATVGRSRLSSFVIEGSHRDDGYPFEPPTREQLWTRRRSLSEPPIVTTAIPRAQLERPTSRIGFAQNPDDITSTSPSERSFVELEERGRHRLPIVPSGLTVLRPTRTSDEPDYTFHERSRSRQSGEASISPPSKRARLYASDSTYEQASAASQSRISLLREGFELGRSTHPDAPMDSPRADDEGTPRQHLSHIPAEGWTGATGSRPSSPADRLAYRRRSPEERLPHTHYHRPTAIDLTGYRFGGGEPEEEDERLDKSFHSSGSGSGHVRRGSDS